MKIRTGIVLVSCATLAGTLLLACGSQDDNPTNPGGSGRAGSSGSAGSEAGASGSDGNAGNDGTAGSGTAGNDGVAGSDGTGGADGEAGGNGDGGNDGTAGSSGGTGDDDGGAAGGTSGGDGGSCTGTSATITSVAKGTVQPGTQVKLSGVVATSQKFLVSASKKTGSCLWGMFVSEPGLATAVAYSGTMVVNYGDDAVTDADGGVGDCPTGTDLIPDDTKPGDVFDVVGSADKYVPKDAQCNGVAAQVQISKACLISRTSTGGPIPAPAVITNVADFTNAATMDTHRKWGGVLVKIENVDPKLTDKGYVVGQFGVITLTNGLEVHDKLYYDKNDAKSGPKFGASTKFVSITGISHLDYCTWSIEPRDKCTDFDPKSEDCK